MIRQGRTTLTAALLDKNACMLHAPESGAMTRLIRENVACSAHYTLTRGNQTLLSLIASNAAFEYEYGE